MKCILLFFEKEEIYFNYREKQFFVCFAMEPMSIAELYCRASTRVRRIVLQFAPTTSLEEKV